MILKTNPVLSLKPGRSIVGKNWKYSLLIGWVLWSVFSLVIMLSSHVHTNLALAYAVYLMVNMLVFYNNTEDFLGVNSMFAVGVFISFGFNIPLFASGLFNNIADSYLHVNHVDIIHSLSQDNDLLFKTVVVFLTAQIGQLIGNGLFRRTGFIFKPFVESRYPARKISYFCFFVLALLVFLSGFIRYNLNIGVAGVSPDVPFAGYIQYFFCEGVLILILWFLSIASGQKSHVYLILSLLLLLGFTVVQGLLGWRGTIFHLIILSTVVFWYQKIFTKRIKLILGIIVVLCVSAVFFVNFGQRVRSSRARISLPYANTPLVFLSKIIYRTQGTVRLAAVIDYFGELTLLNEGMAAELSEQGLSPTGYIDYYVWGVEPERSHSVGTSGPGGVYTVYGFMGVFLGYVLWGSFLRVIYNQVIFAFDSVGIMTSIIMYAFAVNMSFRVLSENYDMGTLKTLAAIMGLLFVFNQVFFVSNSKSIFKKISIFPA